MNILGIDLKTPNLGGLLVVFLLMIIASVVFGVIYHYGMTSRGHAFSMIGAVTGGALSSAYGGVCYPRWC